jgi:hypothetical protein
MMNGHGKSDSSVVPQKSPNKAGPEAAEEEAEGRGTHASKTRPGRGAGAARPVRWSEYVKRQQRTEDAVHRAPAPHL